MFSAFGFFVKIYLYNRIFSVFRQSYSESFQLGSDIVIYSKVKELCRQKGISIYALEKALGFSTASISKWNTSSPRIDRLQKVAEFFGVPVSYFID